MTQLTKGALISARKCTKSFFFGSRALPGPTGGAYSAPQTLYLCLRGTGRDKRRERGKTRGQEREGTGERREEGGNRGVKGVKEGRQEEDGKSRPHSHF